MIDAWERLQANHPWPAECPDVPEDRHGWSHGQQLIHLIGPGAGLELVLELGTWLGRSTRCILDGFPNARVISVDHGQAGMARLPAASRPDVAQRLPTLDATVRRNLWAYRDRLILITADTLAGIAEVFGTGLSPDVCFVDAGHTYDEVTAELRLLRQCWPSMPILGDDFPWPDVARAVRDFAQKHGCRLDLDDVCWRLTPSPEPAP